MKSLRDSEYQHIPGWELVSEGLKDITEGRHHTVAALLVFMATPRLRFLGLDIPHYPGGRPSDNINFELYHLLEETTPDPYSQYNALRRRLASFCSAMESLGGVTLLILLLFSFPSFLQTWGISVDSQLDFLLS